MSDLLPAIIRLGDSQNQVVSAMRELIHVVKVNSELTKANAEVLNKCLATQTEVAEILRKLNAAL